MNRQRMTFQLTPLLDLLLIVIFAQYMEVQNQAKSAQTRLARERGSLEKQYNGDYAVNGQLPLTYRVCFLRMSKNEQ